MDFTYLVLNLCLLSSLATAASFLVLDFFLSSLTVGSASSPELHVQMLDKL